MGGIGRAGRGRRRRWRRRYGRLFGFGRRNLGNGAGSDGRSRLRSRGRLLRRLLGLLGLDLALQTLALGLTPDAVGLGVLDARRVALDSDPERAAEIERLLVGEPELSRQLVNPDSSACQLLVQPFLLLLP
jgi:hypothetical protein